MFTTLLESRRQIRRQYRYTIMSVSAHAAIIAAALIAATASAATRHDGDDGITPITYVDIRKPPRAIARPATRTGADVNAGSALPTLPDIVIADVPAGPRLPSIDLPATPGHWDPAATGTPGESAGGADSGTPDRSGGLTSDSPLFPHQVERTAALRNRVEPRYPATLRAAGIEGRVIARFVVDTSGRAEEASIRILESSHAQFTEAARVAIVRMRFEPARVGRDKVRQLVDLPFTFTLTR